MLCTFVTMSSFCLRTPPTHTQTIIKDLRQYNASHILRDFIHQQLHSFLLDDVVHPLNPHKSLRMPCGLIYPELLKWTVLMRSIAIFRSLSGWNWWKTASRLATSDCPWKSATAAQPDLTPTALSCLLVKSAPMGC